MVRQSHRHVLYCTLPCHYRPSSSSESKTTPTVPPSLPKLPLAQYRYGREEMLLFYSEQVPYPEEMPFIATLARKETIPPLAISPLSPQEQVGVARQIPDNNYCIFIPVSLC